MGRLSACLCLRGMCGTLTVPNGTSSLVWKLVELLVEKNLRGPCPFLDWSNRLAPGAFLLTPFIGGGNSSGFE